MGILLSFRQMLELQLPSDEGAPLADTREYILRSTGLSALAVEHTTGAAVSGEDALPEALRVQLPL